MSAAGGSRSRSAVENLVLRRAADLAEGARADTAVAVSRIIAAALDDLAAKQGRPPFSAPDDHAAPTLRHVMETDGERFTLAYDGERPVGFGAGLVRGAFSYCAGLFVLPEWQGRGLGRRLFETALDGLPVAGGVTALTSSAANPTSNGLYARHGIYPRHALLVLSGPVAALVRSPASHASRLDAEPLAPAHLAELRAIDEAVLGFDRTPDHLWFLSRPDHPGWLLRRRGRAVAYAYLGGDHTEGAGSVGPIATLRPGDQAAALRVVAAELVARGQEQATVVVPGPNLAAQRLLWGAGFAFEGATGLLCASRPFARFDRYVLAGDSIM
jgi:GNAT superfamily N-acetyltransferase